MKKILAIILCLALALSLFGCKDSSGSKQTEPESTVPQTTAPVAEPTVSFTTAPVVTEPVVTEPVVTEPPETVPPTTLPPETEPVTAESILLAVMENRLPLRSMEGQTMYLDAYLPTLNATSAFYWEYLDFDQDGENEIFAMTDSSFSSYLVLHWTGETVCVFDFGYRAVQEVKENGYISGANSASCMSYYRLGFSGNNLQIHSLAELDYAAESFVVDGKRVGIDEADDFLYRWCEIPNVLGVSSYPPAREACAYCAERVYAEDIDPATGLCSLCREYIGRCSLCGELSDSLFEGVCEVCEPWGGRGPWDYCSICGEEYSLPELVEGKCPNCR